MYAKDQHSSLMVQSQRVLRLNTTSFLAAWFLVGCVVVHADDPRGNDAEPASPSAVPSTRGLESAVDFNRDVRPILSAHCLRCHGFDEKTREAGLRLDDRESAVRARAIVANHPERSELIRRVSAADPEERMPPIDSGSALTPGQIALMWVRDAPGVTAPLLGARTVAQLEPYLATEDLELPAEITAALDDVSGGPNVMREGYEPTLTPS